MDGPATSRALVASCAPEDSAPFKLGSWGTIVNILALVWGISMEINFLWPRDITVGGQNPPLTALFPNIGSIFANIPVFEATLGVIVIVGAIYYLVAQRGKDNTPAMTPAAQAGD